MPEPHEAICARCNNYRLATDLGVIDGVPLCHGATDRSPTCYEHTTAALVGFEAMPGHLVARFTTPATGSSVEDPKETCPRCGSEDLHHGEESPDPDICGPSYAKCLDCDHRWGEAYPDSQGVPLPEGMVDCETCDRRGEIYGYWNTCGRCKGTGIIQKE